MKIKNTFRLGTVRFFWRDLYTNLPLLLGGIILLALVLVVLIGPFFASQNPYIAGQHIPPHFDKESGVFIRPPLEPSAEFPLGTNRWGTDILSLLLHGARNTLIISFFITLIRLALGVILGSYAGWNEGKLSDRVIMSATGVLSSIPLLISSMILVFALDIRRGAGTFIIALSLIGWTEIAQYIRSELLVLRKMAFVEGARSLGVDDRYIVVRHIFPNLLPQLLVLSFLEMGAVLMLLGELGFLGVFIGGGHQIAIAELMSPTQIYTLAEIPEWGAMLAEGSRWLRSKPFVVLPPAAAFFISIIGFTSLGEGLRRLFEKRSINTAFLLKKRTLLALAVFILASGWTLQNIGATPWYIQVAQSFNAEQALTHIETLAQMDGRGAAQAGGYEAAAYIQTQFEENGLMPGWRSQEYIYPIETRIVRPVQQPIFALLDENGNTAQSFTHQIDFGYMIEGHAGSGDVTLPLTYVGFDGDAFPSWEDYQGLDLRERIVIVWQDEAPEDFADEALLRGARGVIWVSGAGQLGIRSQIDWADAEKTYQRAPNLPVFRIRPGIADAILEQAGVTFDALKSGLDSDQRGAGWFATDLDAIVHMSLQLDEPQDVEIPSVLGYRMGSDFALATELVIVFANYDGLGIDPDGTIFPAANENASGVGVLLEMARLWHVEQIDPRRPVLFVAWGGGQLDARSAQAFFADRFNFRHLITNNPSDQGVFPTYIVELNALGAGGDNLMFHPTSSALLSELFRESAREFELPIAPEADASAFPNSLHPRNIDWLSLRWENATRLPTEDRIDNISVEKLQPVGETLSLMLIKLVRETDE